MIGKSFLLTIYQSKQTVFTLKGLSQLLPEVGYDALKNKVAYAVRTGKLLALRKGVYGKEGYSGFELANKIYSPSYISLETVLSRAGVIFQNYETIFAASYLTRKIKVKDQEIYYRKFKDDVLMNSLGVVQEENYWIATPERAFLDAVFLYKDYHFDNLDGLDWNKIKKMASIYQSQALMRRLLAYYKENND